MLQKILPVFFLGAIFAFLTPAQSQKPPGKTYVLKAAALFDGKSDTLTTPGLVVVTGNRILAVGANASIPAGAEVIDLGDATILPGFIDAHTHLSYIPTITTEQNSSA